MKRTILILVLTILAILAMLASSYAGSIVSGGYTGVETWDEFVQTPAGVTETTGSSQAMFYFESFNYGGSLYLSLQGAVDVSIDGPATDWTLTPTSASGSVTQGSLGGPDGGDYFATFDSIGPDGQVVGGNAVADFEQTTLNGPVDTITYTRFVSLPEPSSIILMASAVLLFALRHVVSK
jgi:hypothetical protein